MKKEFTLEDSLETQFIYCIHKTLLSFSHLKKKEQEVIINDIRIFIQKLTLLFENQNVLSPQERRLKIIDALVKYLDRLFKYQIFHFLPLEEKNELLDEIENDAKESTIHHLKKIYKKNEVSKNVNQNQQNTDFLSHPKKDLQTSYSSENNDLQQHCSNIQESIIQENIESYEDLTNNIEYMNETSNITEEDNDNNNINNIENIMENNINNTKNNNITNINNTNIPVINNNIWEQWQKICIEKCELYFERNMRVLEEKWVQKLLECKRNISQVDREMDGKVEMGIRSKFIEMENQIKKFIRDSLMKVHKLENDNNDKTNQFIQKTKSEFNELIQEKISVNMKNQFEDLYGHLNTSFQDIMKNVNKIEDQLSESLSERIDDYIKDINNKLKDNFQTIIEKNKEWKNWKNEFLEKYEKDIQKTNENIQTNLSRELEDKVKILSSLFQTNLNEYFEKITQKINEHQQDYINSNPQTSINPELFNLLQLQFSKDENEVQLCHKNKVISSIKINVKGMLGPKGPQGIQGKTPKIKSIRINHDNKIVFTLDGDNGDYDIVSTDKLPEGPQGPKGEKGDHGVIYNDLKFDNENVIRLDNENNNQIILLKSMSIGDKSHCLQDNSLAIGGATCYKQESFSIGKMSKTCDNQSVAMFGTTTGRNAFSYRATNVDDNQVKFGNTKNDIQSFEINSKKIIFNSEQIEILGKIKIQHYEERISELEHKIHCLTKCK